LVRVFGLFWLTSFQWYNRVLNLFYMPPRQNKIQIIKYAPPPSELPMYGSVDSQHVSFIGRTNYVASLEEKKYIFGIKRIDRRRHAYIIGKSGVGKSKLLELFVRQDIAYGYGLCLIDTHGDLINEILDFIPEERADDVYIVDPTYMDLLDSFDQHLFEQKINELPWQDLINTQKIILVNLAKEKIEEQNARFLSDFILKKIKQVGIVRSKMETKDRNDFYLYIDEFQNVATDTFEDFLSEARKYGICVTIAHKYMGQLLPKIQHAVLGNVGTIICFRVGGEDAVTLRPDFAPVFDIKDMINLGIGEFYIKTIIDGESYDPFSAETLKVLPAPYTSSKEEIIQSSRKKF